MRIYRDCDRRTQAGAERALAAFCLLIFCHLPGLAQPSNLPVNSWFPGQSNQGQGVNNSPAINSGGNSLPPPPPLRQTAPKSGAMDPYAFLKPARPSGPAADLMVFPNVYPPHFARMENAISDQKISDDYFRDVMQNTKNRVFRFSSMPIPVFINPAPAPDYTQACISAFENWENRSTSLIRFVQVNDPDRARIKVVWSHLGSGPDGDKGMLGAHTELKWSERGSKLKSMAMLKGGQGGKFNVPAQIIEVNLDVIDSRPAENRPVLLKATVTHELGHALGLIGHSPHNADMMFADTDEYSRISQRDLNTLKRLYNTKVDVPL